MSIQRLDWTTDDLRGCFDIIVAAGELLLHLVYCINFLFCSKDCGFILL